MNYRIAGMRTNRWRESDGMGRRHRRLRASANMECGMFKESSYMFYLFNRGKTGGDILARIIST